MLADLTQAGSWVPRALSWPLCVPGHLDFCIMDLYSPGPSCQKTVDLGVQTLLLPRACSLPSPGR
jgi:hypothetical protein